MVASRARILPQVTGGVTTMREDAAGRFYVLESSGHSIQIFDANGNPAGQIPTANSGASAFSYAADFDVAPDGSIIVADRGTNHVQVFAPDGSLKAKVAVFAPTSVVALSNGQFAVTTLRTEHPVEVIDEDGRVVRGFGEAHPSTSYFQYDAPPQAATPLADTGRIVGDSADHLYFALASASDPQIRKYDRFGYALYATTVPVPVTDQGSAYSRLEFGFNFMRLTRSEQINTWTTVGSSGNLQFGANAGMGLAGLMGGGRGLSGGRRGAGGNDSVAGSLTADASIRNPSLNIHLGLKANNRGRGQAQPNGDSSQGSDSSATLQFQGAGTSSGADDTASASADGSNTLQYVASNGSTIDATGAFPGTLDYMVGTPQGGYGGRGAGVGGFSSFFLGGLGPRAGGYQHPFLGGGAIPAMADHMPASAPAGLLASAPGTGPSASTPAAPGRPDFGGRGHFGSSALNFAGSVRLNLDHPRPVDLTEKAITAVGVDRRTQEIWAATGPMLVHFDKDGNPLDTYYLTTPDGATLHTTAIVIEPDRLLIGSASGGIYDFARPDKVPAARTSPVGNEAPKSPTQ